MRHVAVVLLSGGLVVVQQRSRIAKTVVADAEDGPGVLLATGEGRSVKNGPDERHRVMARIVAVRLSPGELVIDIVTGAVRVDMENDTVAAAFPGRGRSAAE